MIAKTILKKTSVASLALAVLMSLVAAGPAQAALSLSLAPESGTGFNSIRQSGTILATNIGDLGGGCGTLKYQISSSDGTDVRDIAFSLRGITSSSNLTKVNLSTTKTVNNANRVVYSYDGDSCALPTAANANDVFAFVSASDGASNLNFQVTSWFDTGTNVNSVDGSEVQASADVVLYSDRNVSGTITLDRPAITDTLASVFTLAPGLEINPHMVSDLAQNGSSLRAFFNQNGGNFEENRSFSVSAEGVLVATSSAAVVFGNYSVRAYYFGVAVISGNAIFQNFVTEETLLSGSVKTVLTGVRGAMITGDNLRRPVSNQTAFEARAGISEHIVTVTAVAPIKTELPVKAVISTSAGQVSAQFLSAGSVPVSTTGASVEVFGTTTSAGIVPLRISGSAGNGHDVQIDLFVYKAGEWIAHQSTATTSTANGSRVTITWVSATLTSFQSADSAFAGKPAFVPFFLRDQFGKGINTHTDGSPLAITVVAAEGMEQLNPGRYKQTLAVPENGNVTMTIENFSPVGGSVRLVAQLHFASMEWSEYTILPNRTLNLSMFNNAETFEVTTVENKYQGEVTYSAFTISATDYAARISGAVETVNGSTAAAQEVSISGAGLYFVFDPTSYVNISSKRGSENGISITTDTDGSFSVDVFAHKVNAAGISIRITSGGKSTDVLLSTFHNRDLVAVAGNNKLTWDFPSYPGLGVTVATATFTDKWDNPVAGATIDFASGPGYLFVNGNPTVVSKTTNAKGKASVRIRGFTTGRLQAPASAEVNLEAIALRSANLLEGVNRVELYRVKTDATTFVPLTSSNLALIASESELWSGFFGTQATASAAATMGQVNVTAFNAVGKKIRVFIGAKLVATKQATKRVTKITVRNLKSRDVGLTVRIGNKVALFKPLTIR